MAIQQNVKPEAERSDPEQERSESTSTEGEKGGGLAPDARGGEVADPREAGEAHPEEEHLPAPVGAASPTQLGTKRFVYAAYFAGGIAVAFLVSKLIDFAWLKLQSYVPAVGEPRDDVIMPAAAVVGAAAAVYYWYRTPARRLAEEVANEMSKVTWPSRSEVTNGTVVVIITTVVSTVFFALMDKFWGFVTNLVYGGS